VVFYLDDKKTKIIAVTGLLIIVCVDIWLLQSVSVTIMLGNEHTDWFLINGIRLSTKDYNHTQNPPITKDDIQLSNSKPIKDYNVHYEHVTVQQNQTVNGTVFNQTFYKARAVGTFRVPRYVALFHPDLKEYLGISVPKYEREGIS
jgi:hypothetical protein